MTALHVTPDHRYHGKTVFLCKRRRQLLLVLLCMVWRMDIWLGVRVLWRTVLTNLHCSEQCISFYLKTSKQSALSDNQITRKTTMVLYFCTDVTLTHIQ